MRKPTDQLLGHVLTAIDSCVTSVIETDRDQVAVTCAQAALALSQVYVALAEQRRRDEATS